MMSRNDINYPIYLGCLLLLLAFGLRMQGQAQNELWADEAVSLQHVRRGTLPALIESLARNEGMPPLYFLGLYLWRDLGENDFILRFYSIAQGILSIALMIVLGRRVLGARGGGIAASLTVVSSMHIALSQWVRPYALTFCIAIGLLLVAIQLGQRTNFASWVLFWGLATLAMYTLYILGAMLFGVGLYIWYKRRTMGLIKGLAPVAGVGVGVLISFAPWIPILIRQSSWAPQALWWVPPPHLRLLLETVDQFLFSLEGRRWPLPLVIVVICSLIVLLLLGIYRAAKKRRLSLSLLTTLFPLAMIWSASYIRPIFLARHVSFALPGVILLLAEGLTYWAPSIRRIAFIGLVLVGLVAQVTAPIGQDIIIPWSEVASWMEIHAEAGDMIVFSPPFQQTAFEIKYQGPALETRGIGEYQAYVQQPDAIFDVRIPARQLQAWADDRLYFWLLEDRRWPTEWDALRWEYEAIAEARFPGLTIYRFVRQSPTEN